MKTAEIYEIAEKNNIEIVNLSLPVIECMSIQHGKNNYYIAIDPALISSSANERVKLAHDIGHCMTGSFYNEYSPIDRRSKHEYTADKWAIKKLVPLDELVDVMKQGCEAVWELAEIFGVTEEFIRKALTLYESDILNIKKANIRKHRETA
jgi:Zn-dependent peptidase ImmA (M78 family)